MPVAWEKVKQEIDRIDRANGNHIMVLNLSRGWTEPDLKKSYRRICLVLHPDRHPSTDDARKKTVSDYFAKISTSNRLLTDSLKNGASPAFASFTSSFNNPMPFARPPNYSYSYGNRPTPHTPFTSPFTSGTADDMNDVFRTINILFSARLGPTKEQQQRDRKAKREATEAEKRRKAKTIPSTTSDLFDMWEEARRNRK